MSYKTSRRILAALSVTATMLVSGIASGPALASTPLESTIHVTSSPAGLSSVHAAKAKGAASSGMRAAASSGLFYSVYMVNRTSELLTVTLPYASAAFPGVQYATHTLAPGQTVPFLLGPCESLQAYIIQVYWQGQLVLQYPPPGQGVITSQMGGQDGEPCVDAWGIG
jgi:hypothetical protein